MFVKICGITNQQDADAAIDAGAQALGFIFHAQSPRAVTPESVAPWIRRIPPEIWKVGVFVNTPPARIEQIAEALELDIAQLHGTETPADHPKNLRIWKAFRQTAPTEPYPAEAILLDGMANGQITDWTLASRVTQPFILAGGLTPDNIEEAIEKTNPWGVDTASGVESSPGRKDHARMKQFIKAALRS